MVFNVLSWVFVPFVFPFPGKNLFLVAEKMEEKNF